MTDQTTPQTRRSASPFDAGIFKTLIDFSFTTFATPKLIRILYLLSFLGIALGAVAYSSSGSPQASR